MIKQLTVAAQEALITAGTNRQGATISHITDRATVMELQLLGLIGEGRGLTRKGTIVRQRLMDAAMEMAFGF